MGVKWSNTKFSDFSLHPLIRSDYKFINYKKNVEVNYKDALKVKDIINGYYKGFAFLGADFKSNGNIYAIKGDIFNDDFSIDYNKASFLPLTHFEHPKYQKFKVFKNDIIVSLVGSIGKMVIVDKEIKALLNQNNIALQVNQDIYNIKLFAYLLKYKISILVNSVYKNSGYSFLAINDLFNLKLPKISISKQNKIVRLINPLEKEIKELQASKKEPLAIINEVFAQEFDLNLKRFEKLSFEKTFNINFSNLMKSKDFRMATKFNSIKYDFLNEPIFKKFTFKDFTKFMTLGRQIKPEFYAEKSDYYYLMPNSIKTNSLNDDLMKPIKPTFFKRLEHISLKKNDLILVASGEGSIGKSAIYNSDKKAITSQFVMKIELKNKELADYFYYYMVSYFFQLTVEKFKKGMGNMTNIFASQVINFPVLYDKSKTKKIVSKIKSQIDAQKEIDKKIEEKQNEISELIENAIKTN